MAGNLDLIDTIIILILENRSFDHVLGYLSRGAGGLPVEGIRDDPAWLAQHANSWNGTAYPISRMSFVDPPHGSRAVADQIGRVPAGRTPPMDGFVKVYANGNPKPDDPGLVMGHYTAAEVPMFDFLARNYSVCDHWFAALPAGTQPNKLTAMSGTTPVVDNAPSLLPNRPLVYDWLTDHHVPWCVYQSGDFFPFFTLMPKWIGEIANSLAAADRPGAGGHFRRLKYFPVDWKNGATPRVIFIEPEYSDGPQDSPNDDHPPTAISRGQILVHDIYAALIANPARWERTMMIVTYDEHGGFYDHVPPLPIVTDVKTSTGFLVRLATSGVRVPALVLSPLVEPGSVHALPLDHSSMLQLLADKFDGGRPYSDAVALRQPFLSPLSAVLTRSAPRTQAPPAPALAAPPPAPVGLAAKYPPARGAADNAKAMHLAAAKMIADHPELRKHGLERIAAVVDRGDTALGRGRVARSNPAAE